MEILALIVALLFIVSTPVTFTLFSLEQSVFDADLYIRAMDEQNVYGQVPALTAQTLAIAAQQPGGAGLLSLFRNLPVEQWQAMITQLMPPEVTRPMAVDAVTQILAYLNGERADVILPLSGLKAQLQSPVGLNAINTMLDAQPECTLEQLSAMALGQQAATLCDPPDTLLFFDLRPIITGQINALVSLVPEQVTLIPAGFPRPPYLSYLKDVRILMRLSPLFPILCLGVIAVLVVRTWRGWLNWWGYPLLLAGVLTLFISLFSVPLSSLTFQLLFAPALPAFLPAGVPDMFRNLISAIVSNALQPALIVAGAMLLFGFVMVAIGFLSGPRIRRIPPTYV